jgi:hypothetical protein
MKRAFAIGVLGVVVAGTVVGAIACSSDSGGGPTPGTDSGVKIDTAVPGDGTSIDTLGVDTLGIDTLGTDSPGTDTSTDGGPVLPPACPATLKDGKIAEFQDPASAKKAALNDGLHLAGVIATSPKFLVSKAKSGTCLYGVFVADANATFLPYSGILVVSRGNNASPFETGTGTFCTNGDLIPNDVKAGDVLDLKGTYDMFGPSSATCGGATPPVPPPTPAKGAQLTQLCAYSKTGDGTVPTPATVLPDDIKGVDATAKWAGGLVKVTGVKTKTAVDGFGNFTLDPSGLQVGDKIYYRGAATSPVVPAGTSLTEIVGMSYLDFCTWSLEPRSVCDIKPPPNVGSDGGTAPTCP